jgi:hypothetical protein
MMPHRASACAEPDADPASEAGWQPPPPSLTLSYDRVDASLPLSTRSDMSTSARGPACRYETQDPRWREIMSVRLGLTDRRRSGS